MRKMKKNSIAILFKMMSAENGDALHQFKPNNDLFGYQVSGLGG